MALERTHTNGLGTFEPPPTTVLHLHIRPPTSCATCTSNRPRCTPPRRIRQCGPKFRRRLVVLLGNSPSKTQENDALIEEDDDDDIIITKVTGEKEDKCDLEGLLAQIAQQNSSSKDIVQLCNELKKLPSAPFGVPLLDSGSATAGTQLVMFGSLVKLLESSKQTTSDNNTAVGLIKSINGSLKSIVDGEKTANNAWRESTIVMLSKELKKLELARLEDKEVQKDNWTRFHEWADKLKKNNDGETEKTGSTSRVPCLLKRGSSETVDAVKFGSKNAGLTPKEKILAAQAANDAKPIGRNQLSTNICMYKYCVLLTSQYRKCEDELR
ncbi:uncharacterized protein CELE_T11F9.10 [Caenorhabditis elegans]|uniref:Uncharacterized protein n=1 Tax=Caenorhabditis elegans TaxID=6239 RepID=Q22394_CAEEL|nr:Uncharacterized protein CELE_T11F9.10 [Caenorhabditis elegans]CAA98526.1 Uncharacterized protein CELE_T11F9.10 [Caenorhabditis elegans]|eukprot:NP_505914.1 Uncharacterized protein CELE_T11F9.10 [Caenorhabditis elegans]